MTTAVMRRQAPLRKLLAKSRKIDVGRHEAECAAELFAKTRGAELGRRRHLASVPRELGAALARSLRDGRGALDDRAALDGGGQRTERAVRLSA